MINYHQAIAELSAIKEELTQRIDKLRETLSPEVTKQAVFDAHIYQKLWEQTKANFVHIDHLRKALAAEFPGKNMEIFVSGGEHIGDKGKIRPLSLSFLEDLRIFIQKQNGSLSTLIVTKDAVDAAQKPKAISTGLQSSFSTLTIQQRVLKVLSDKQELETPPTKKRIRR